MKTCMRGLTRANVSAARSQFLDLRCPVRSRARQCCLSPVWREHFGVLKLTCVCSKLNWRRRRPRCACGVKKKKEMGHLFALLQFLTCWSRYEVAFLKVMFRRASVHDLADGYNAGLFRRSSPTWTPQRRVVEGLLNHQMSQETHYYSCHRKNARPNPDSIFFWECATMTSYSRASDTVAASRLCIQLASLQDREPGALASAW